MNEKGEWTNFETKTMSEQHGNLIEEVIQDNPNLSEMDLIAKVSETVENEIVENHLIHISEGYISEIIHASFKLVDYVSLIKYYKS